MNRSMARSRCPGHAASGVDRNCLSVPRYLHPASGSPVRNLRGALLEPVVRHRAARHDIRASAGLDWLIRGFADCSGVHHPRRQSHNRQTTVQIFSHSRPLVTPKCGGRRLLPQVGSGAERATHTSQEKSTFRYWDLVAALHGAVPGGTRSAQAQANNCDEDPARWQGMLVIGFGWTPVHGWVCPADGRPECSV